ncbi:MAG: hypothetical protein RLY31_359 [Bacteroidota bacterium]|jgi:hypothetical protein
MTALLTVWLGNCVGLLHSQGSNGDVLLQPDGDHYVMSNGWLSVRLARATGFDPSFPDFIPAPLQQVIYADGSAGSSLPVYLRSTAPPVTMQDTVLYQTTDSCAVRIRYTFDKPALYSSNNAFLEPEGPGYYQATFRMFKGEKVCMVLEESDFEVGYELRVSGGLSPDRGMYQGHYATTAADGYDLNGQVYARGENTGWNARVNLGYSGRKDYPMLARWNPWVVNSGWHWQLYDSDAGAGGNVFGIFDGRPSQLLGIRSSGANIYTDAAGLDDIHGACDDDICHYVWQSDNKLLYKRIDADGGSQPEIVVAQDLVHPFIFLSGNTVNILAFDPYAASGQALFLLKKVGAAPFVIHQLDLDATITDPYLYGASNGTYDFILLQGSRDIGTGSAQDGFHLFAAPVQTLDFGWQDVIDDGLSWRSANRPDLQRTPDGSILLTYAANGYYGTFDRIPADSVRFVQTPFPPTQTVSIGTAIDPVTGRFFEATNDGWLRLVQLQDTTVTAVHATNLSVSIYDLLQARANRRTLATDSGGNCLATLENYQGGFYWYDNNSQEWSALSLPEWSATFPHHVHYNSTVDSFFVVGKYQGQLTRFRTKNGTDVTLVEQFPTTAMPVAGVKVNLTRVSPPYYFPEVRFEWCLFAGTQGADLLPPDQVQPIGLAMNRLSGLAGKLDAYQSEPLPMDSSFLTGALFKPRADLLALMAEIRTNNDLYDELVDIDPYFTGIMNAWRDAPGNPVATNAAYQSVMDYAHGLRTALTTGDGIYSYYHHYSLGSNEMQLQSMKIAGLLADDKLTSAQRDTLLQVSRLYCRVIWDRDFVPFSNDTGLNFGTISQATTFSLRRWFFCLIASESAEFSARAALIPGYLDISIADYVNESGAAKGSPHYLQPTMDQMILIGLQLRESGMGDVFSSNLRLKYLADFLFHLKTPPSVRFQQYRKLVSLGDGAEESAAVFGLLATGFAATDTLLSRRLMHAYRNGRVRGSEFGFVTLSVNQQLPDTSWLNMGDGRFPGYMSTFRRGRGTPLESASWLVDGEWYSDHRNDDRGQAAIYALGTPLSLNFSSFYSPHMASAHQKNCLVKETMFPDWNNTTGQPFGLADAAWYHSANTAFEAFEYSGHAAVRMTRQADVWTRRFFQFHLRPDLPCFILHDSVDSPAPFIWNFNFMATDSVQTPTGPVLPPSSFWSSQGGPQQLPRASSPVPLDTGFNRFDFQGQNWVAHPTGGIDWELYLETADPDAAVLCDVGHDFIPTPEKEEFLATNGVASFSEKQVVMRAKGGGHFTTLILPYAKGQRPADLSVYQSQDTIHVDLPGVFHFSTDLSFASYQEAGGKAIHTSYVYEPLPFGDLLLAGGPMEVSVLPDTITALIHGTTGFRLLTLPPGNWRLANAVAGAVFDGTSWSLPYSYADSLHNSYVGGGQEYVFVRTPRLAARVFLQGPFDASTGWMHDSLRVRTLLPSTEPYSVLGFASAGLGGGEMVDTSLLDTTGANAVVDWVWVEIRSKLAPAIVLATRGALLQRDGDVTGTEARFPLDFPELPQDSYYVAVRHRNHLAVCTAGPVFFSLDSLTTLDFSHPDVETWGDHSRASLPNGAYAMWAGDADGDGRVVFAGVGTDVTAVSAPVLTNPVNTAFVTTMPLSGYFRADLNMDGSVIYDGAGKDVTLVSDVVLLHPDNSDASPTLPVFEQLPN